MVVSCTLGVDKREKNNRRRSCDQRCKETVTLDVSRYEKNKQSK